MCGVLWYRAAVTSVRPALDAKIEPWRVLVCRLGFAVLSGNPSAARDESRVRLTLPVLSRVSRHLASLPYRCRQHKRAESWGDPTFDMSEHAGGEYPASINAWCAAGSPDTRSSTLLSPWSAWPRHA